MLRTKLFTFLSPNEAVSLKDVRRLISKKATEHESGIAGERSNEIVLNKRYLAHLFN